MHPDTVAKGREEADSGEELGDRVRGPGAGRKGAAERDPGLEEALFALVRPATRALRLHPAVREAVVVMVGEHSRRRLVAHVVSSDERVDAELLRQHVASLLPQVMVPAQVTWHDQLPLSGNGKIDRKALTAWAPEGPSPEPGAEAVPMDGLESAIAAIWAEILGVPVVGRSDLFFDLGGNSMTAVLVTGELSDQLGADVPPRIMFDLASLADVASALRADPELGPLASAMVARLESAPA